MTIAEIVWFLRRDGHSLKDIAGYDDRQMRCIWFRRTDERGNLVLEADQKDLPPGVRVDSEGQRLPPKNPVGLRTVFYKVARRRWGLSREEADARWRDYLAENPKLGVGGE